MDLAAAAAEVKPGARCEIEVPLARIAAAASAKDGREES
jgi:hypothetical protein